jgi:RNA polymerase sigma-70 factor (ECF subfamily)
MCYIFIMGILEDSLTDEDIILAYKDGNLEAFKKLIDRYTPLLYNFTARLSNKNDAPDIVQESFVKVWKNLNRFDSKRASFKTWIFTIAKNTTTDFLRKKKSILFSDMPGRTGGNNKDVNEEKNSFAENIPAEETLPDLALIKLEDSAFLNQILEKLTPSYREVLVLHYQEEMTFDEIGKVLDKPLNTVKSQHRRAIMELRRMIDLTAPN